MELDPAGPSVEPCEGVRLEEKHKPKPDSNTSTVRPPSELWDLGASCSTLEVWHFALTRTDRSVALGNVGTTELLLTVSETTLFELMFTWTNDPLEYSEDLVCTLRSK